MPLPSDDYKFPRYPVFIVGSPRSGTSAMVDALLGAGYHGFREGNFIPLADRIGSEVERHFASFDIGTSKVLVGCVDKEMIKRKINHLFRAVVNSLNPEPPWFDKSGGPDMIRFLPTVLELWPTGRVIFAKRRGIENIASRVRKFPGLNFEQHCLEWKNTMLAWRETRPRLHGVSVEIDQWDMIRQPEIVAHTLTDLLDLSLDRERALRDMLASTRPQETEPGSAARSLTLDTVGWSAAQKEMFLKHCGAELDAFDYSLGEDYRTTSASGAH
jgi:Sulfotransferase family